MLSCDLPEWQQQKDATRDGVTLTDSPSLSVAIPSPRVQCRRLLSCVVTVKRSSSLPKKRRLTRSTQAIQTLVSRRSQFSTSYAVIVENRAAQRYLWQHLWSCLFAHSMFLQTDCDLHEKRTGHSNFSDKTAESAMQIDYSASAPSGSASGANAKSEENAVLVFVHVLVSRANKPEGTKYRGPLSSPR